MKSLDTGKLYEELSPKLIGICRRYVGCTQLAKDLVHDAFIKSIEKRNTFQGKGSAEAWIMRITINHTLQYIKQNSHENTQLFDLQIPDPQSTEAMNEKWGIRAMIERAAFSVDELLEMIDALPLHHKLVFNMHVLEGFKHQQIGQMLGISAGTSKSHLARARKSLQKLLLEKAKLKKGEYDERKLIWLLLFKHPVDQVFQKGFQRFQLSSSPLSQNSIVKYKVSVSSFVLPVAVAAIVGCLAYNTFKSVGISESVSDTIVLPDTCCQHDSLNREVQVISDFQQTNKIDAKAQLIPEPVVKHMLVKKQVVVYDTIRVEKKIE